mgnify:FL=1
MRYEKVLTLVFFGFLTCVLIAGGAITREENTNRPGFDYSTIPLDIADPALCEQKCLVDSGCMAYTYVKPGVQGEKANCWLKSSVPVAESDPNCVSGVKSPGSMNITVCFEPDMEIGTNRPGSDYKDFDLTNRDACECRDACNKDATCKAYTYVKSGAQGEKPRCWLKNSVPEAKSDVDCISGIKKSGSGTTTGCNDPDMEIDTDRPGSNYKNFDLSSPNPCECRDGCNKDTACKAYTYVKPGIQGQNARCWLKNSVPGKVQNTDCISGTKGGNQQKDCETKIEKKTPEKFTFVPMNLEWGDKDFDGSAYIDLDVSFKNLGDEVIGEIKFSADENKGGKIEQDRTFITGETTVSLYTPPIGWKVIDFSPKKAKKHSYIDMDHENDYFPLGSGAINELEYVGDTDDDDLGRTGVIITWNEFQFKIQNTENC